jgi:hypothetical protein
MDCPVFLYRGKLWQTASAFLRSSKCTSAACQEWKTLNAHTFEDGQTLLYLGGASFSTIPTDYKTGALEVFELGKFFMLAEVSQEQYETSVSLHPQVLMKILTIKKRALEVVEATANKIKIEKTIKLEILDEENRRERAVEVVEASAMGSCYHGRRHFLAAKVQACSYMDAAVSDSQF